MGKKRKCRFNFSQKVFPICRHRGEPHSLPEELQAELAIGTEGVSIQAIGLGSVGGVGVFGDGEYTYLLERKAFLSQGGVFFIYEEEQNFEEDEYHRKLVLATDDLRVYLVHLLIAGTEFSRSVHEKVIKAASKKMGGYGFRSPKNHVTWLSLEQNRDTNHKNGQHHQLWKVYFKYEGKEFAEVVKLRCVYHHNRGGNKYVCYWEIEK